MNRNVFISLILLNSAFVCIGCGNKNTSNVNDTADETDSLFAALIESKTQEVEEDSFEVKPFVLLSETLLEDEKKTLFVVQIPEKYKGLDLHIMLSRLAQKCKKTKDFDVAFFVKGSKLNDTPYAVGYIKGSTCHVDLTSELKEEEAKKIASNNIKREFVGKWPSGSPDDVMTIYKYNGKYYLEYQINGEFTGDRVELVRSKHQSNVFKFKDKNEGDETYEIVEGGMYAIETNGARMFFPSAR